MQLLLKFYDSCQKLMKVLESFKTPCETSQSQPVKSRDLLELTRLFYKASVELDKGVKQNSGLIFSELRCEQISLFMVKFRLILLA